MHRRLTRSIFRDGHLRHTAGCGILLHLARDAVLTALSFLLSHALQDRRLRVRCPATEFLENPGPFVLLFKSPQRAVNRLVVLYGYAYHYYSPPLSQFCECSVLFYSKLLIFLPLSFPLPSSGFIRVPVFPNPRTIVQVPHLAITRG